MNWSMPRPVLQVVASAIAVACLGAFTLGVFTAPARSRLPGDGPVGKSAEVLQAADAQPLIDERIQGAATADELTPEEQAAAKKRFAEKHPRAGERGQSRHAPAAAASGPQPPASAPAK